MVKKLLFLGIVIMSAGMSTVFAQQGQPTAPEWGKVFKALWELEYTEYKNQQYVTAHRILQYLATATQGYAAHIPGDIRLKASDRLKDLAALSPGTKRDPEFFKKDHPDIRSKWERSNDADYKKDELLNVGHTYLREIERELELQPGSLRLPFF